MHPDREIGTFGGLLEMGLEIWADSEGIEEITMSLYQPSNGTEGCMFEAVFCDRCWNERPQKKSYCKIHSAAIWGPVKEWIADEKGPRCTKFELISEHKPRRRENKYQPCLFPIP